MMVFGKRRKNAPTKRKGSVGFPDGLNTLGHPSTLKESELSELINGTYSQYGTISKRLGSTILGSETGNEILNLQACYKINGQDYFIRISDTGVPERFNFTTLTWDTLSGTAPSGYVGTNPAFTAGVPTFDTSVITWIVQLHNKIYFANSVNELVWFDGSAWFIYSSLADPTGYATVAKTGTGTGYTKYYYRWVDYNEAGGTATSPAVTVQASGTGWIDLMPYTLNDTTYVTITLPAAAAGSTKRSLWRGNSAGDEGYLVEIPASQTVFVDKGEVEPNYFWAPPTENTTKGYHFHLLETYRGSLVGVTTELGRDTLVWSGAGEDYGSFGQPDGAGFLGYREGEGSYINAIKTFVASNEDSLFIFKDNVSGKFQFVDTQREDSAGTIRDINISIGSVSPFSPHIAGNNLRFWSREGASSFGNQANYGTILRYSVMSLKADSIVQQVIPSNLHKVSGVFHKHLTLFGIPLSESTGNNAILAYDERYDAWSLWTGEYPAMFCKCVHPTTRVESLYYGSSIDGKVAEMFKGKTQYNGDPITLSLTTKQYDMGFPDQFKKFDKVTMVFGTLSGNNTTVGITRADQDGIRNDDRLLISSDVVYSGFGHDRWGTINIGEMTTGSSGTSVPVKFIDLKQKDLFWASLNIQNNGIQDEVSIIGVYFYYSNSAKPLPFTTKVTETA